MAIQIPYVKLAWVDGTPNQGSAANFNHVEEGILDVSQAPAVRVFHNAAQSITNNTVTALAFNSERFDQAGGVASTQHDTVTNNSRLTCLYAGVYQISGGIQWAAAAGGERQLIIRHSVGPTSIRVRNDFGSASITQDQVVTALYALAVNEYVELCVFQNSGGALNVNVSGAISPEFEMVRVG